MAQEPVPTLDYTVMPAGAMRIRRQVLGQAVSFVAPPERAWKVALRLVAIALVLFILGSLTWLRLGELREGDDNLLAILVGVGACAALACAGVVEARGAWTPVVVRADPEGVTIIKPGLLGRRRRHLPTGRVRFVWARPLGTGLTGSRLGRLEIGGRLLTTHAFTGHHLHELRDVARTISDAIGSRGATRPRDGPPAGPRGGA